MATVLSLDPSLRAYGWAIIQDDKVLECGCIITDSIKGEIQTNSDTLRLVVIAQELHRIIEKYKAELELIVFENPVGSKSSRANQSLSYVKGITVAAATFSCIPFKTIRAKTVKKELTGESDADKQTIYEEVLIKYPEVEQLTKGWSKAKKFAATDAVAVFMGWSLQ